MVYHKSNDDLTHIVRTLIGSASKGCLERKFSSYTHAPSLSLRDPLRGSLSVPLTHIHTGTQTQTDTGRQEDARTKTHRNDRRGKGERAGLGCGRRDLNPGYQQVEPSFFDVRGVHRALATLKSNRISSSSRYSVPRLTEAGLVAYLLNPNLS